MGGFSASHMRAIGIILPTLCAVAVVGRFLGRRKKKAGYGFDDWLCIPALLSVAGLGGLVIYGADKHAFDSYEPPAASGNNTVAATRELSAELFAIFGMVQAPVIALVKIIILLFYRRIFVGRVFTICNWTLISIMVAWAIAFFFASVFACGIHVNKQWMPFKDSSVTAPCINRLTAMSVNPATDAFLDGVVFAFPLFWIWRLQMRTSQKLKVTVLFWFGSVALGASIARAIVQTHMHQVYEAPSTSDTMIAGLPAFDLIGAQTIVVFWGYMEVGMALFACCLPALQALLDGVDAKPLFARVKTSLRRIRSEELRVSGNVTNSHAQSTSVDGVELSGRTQPHDHQDGNIHTPRDGKGSRLPGIHMSFLSSRKFGTLDPV